MKKGEKPPPAEDIDFFEEWEETSVGGKPNPDPVKEPKAPPPTAKPTVKAPPSPVAEESLHMSADVPVHLVAVIGRTTATVKDMMNYQMGQVIDLGRPPGETVDLVASGKLFAKGELVDIDGKLGVRIVKIVR